MNAPAAPASPPRCWCCSSRCWSTSPTCRSFAPPRCAPPPATAGCCSRSTPTSAARSSWPASRSPRAPPPTTGCKYLRQYSDGPLYAPATGYYSFVYGATGDRARREHHPRRLRRPAVRPAGCSTCSPAASRRAATSRSPSNPRAQKAASDGLGDRRGAVVALDPRTGAILAHGSHAVVRPQPAVQPRPDRDPRRDGRAARRPGDPLLNRAIRQRYPPGSTFKIVTAAAALASGATRRHRDPRPGGARPAADHRRAPQLRPAPVHRRQRRDHAAPGAAPSPATPRSARSAWTSATTRCASRPRSSASTRRCRCRCPPRAACSRPRPTPRRPPSRRSASTTSRATPLQMAMVAAAIANNGMLMKPYLVSEVRAPDLTVLSRTEPEAALDRGVARRSPRR